MLLECRLGVSRFSAFNQMLRFRLLVLFLVRVGCVWDTVSDQEDVVEKNELYSQLTQLDRTV